MPPKQLNRNSLRHKLPIIQLDNSFSWSYLGFFYHQQFADHPGLPYRVAVLSQLLVGYIWWSQSQKRSNWEFQISSFQMPCPNVPSPIISRFHQSFLEGVPCFLGEMELEICNINKSRTNVRCNSGHNIWRVDSATSKGGTCCHQSFISVSSIMKRLARSLPQGFSNDFYEQSAMTWKKPWSIWRSSENGGPLCHHPNLVISDEENQWSWETWAPLLDHMGKKRTVSSSSPGNTIWLWLTVCHGKSPCY